MSHESPLPCPEPLVLIIAIFFVTHWVLAAFVQVFFLHRYAAHRQFTMSKGWERFFYLLTYVVLGSSYLPPYAYAVLHRMHHAYSDSEKDPHSPENYRTPFGMILATRRSFDDLAHRRTEIEPRFAGGGGCACRATPGHAPRSLGWIALALLGFALVSRRR